MELKKMKDLSFLEQASLVAGDDKKPECGCDCNNVSCNSNENSFDKKLQNGSTKGANNHKSNKKS